MASTPTFVRATAQTWARLDAAAAHHGASFYLADPARFEENHRRLLGAFQARYPRTSIGYSYKTNYLPHLIRRAHDLGAYAEVVSRFEFDLARELGVEGRRIIFNGPVKGDDDLLVALRAGARLNADSLPELRRILALAGGLPEPVAVGVRCHLSPHETPGSRFGIDLTGPEGADALRELDAAPNVRLSDLHCHHSGDRSAERYRDRTRAMVRLHTEVLGGRPLDAIDIGGGFASPMSPALAAQLPSPPSTFEDYAEAVATEMQRAYGDGGPELILEPGMGLLADTTVFVTRVETVKLLGGRHLAVVDGSIFNVKPLLGAINLPIHVIPAEDTGPRGDGPWDVVGHTCMEIDLLHAGYRGPIGIGDYIVVENAGAYTNVLNAPFIRGTPPILELDEDGPGRLLRPGSTVADLLRSYGESP